MRRYLTGSFLIAYIEVRYSPLYYGLLIMCNEKCGIILFTYLSCLTFMIFFSYRIDILIFQYCPALSHVLPKLIFYINCFNSYTSRIFAFQSAKVTPSIKHYQQKLNLFILLAWFHTTISTIFPV